MTLWRSLLARLSSLLRRRARPKAVPVRNTVPHIPISSFLRRYPGRTAARELRRNAGWIAIAAVRPDRDRRA